MVLLLKGFLHTLQVNGQDLLPQVAPAAGDGRSNPAMPAGGPGPERSALHGLSGISRGGLEAAEEVCLLDRAVGVHKIHNVQFLGRSSPLPSLSSITCGGLEAAEDICFETPLLQDHCRQSMLLIRHMCYFLSYASAHAPASLDRFLVPVKLAP